MLIDTQLDIYNFLNITDNIVAEYFNDEGEYLPHFGIINVVRLFYNICVVNSKFDEEIPHNITEPDKIIPLISDKEFMDEFNKAIADTGEIQFDFANAYKNAMLIIDTKRNSMNYALDKIKNMCNELIEKISPAMSEENIDKLSSIVGLFQNGDMNADSILDAYAHSEAFKDTISGNRNEKNEKVVQFKKE